MLGLVASFSVEAAPTEDLMGNLPDAPVFNTTMYSGYLEVTDTKSLHYIFAESYNDPATDPVVIWLNGGPGCSSVLGFMQENGPLAIDDGESVIKVNPFPWNQEANMLYLESPAGVGFSTASASDMSCNDITSAADNLSALLAWYEKFPEYKTNDLFISGESYAGIYVPYFAHEIYQNNLVAEFTPTLWTLPLKGTMVGNGATDWDFDAWPSYPQTIYNFNLIPKRMLDSFNDNDCHLYFRGIFPGSTSDECKAIALQMEGLTMERLNWYDLYRVPEADFNA